METSSSDEEEGRTFVQVVSERYNPENFPCLSGFMMDIVVLSSPQSSPVKDRVTLPSALVLSGYGISRAGDEAELAAFCAHVLELDLSYNQLQDWAEVCTIVSNIPHLDFLNLSMNPLNGVELEPGMAEVFSRLRRLVLINTHVTWDTVHTVTRETPELEELFLCLNDFDAVSERSAAPCPSLRLLQITDNRLQRWAEVRKLGPLYPGLDALVLANNRLASLDETQEGVAGLFPSLRSVNLNNSGLSRWEDIERLNFFPKLEEVKVMGIPLLRPYTARERRSLIVAQLPSVSVLNGSVVTDGEREDAERFYIRHHFNCPEEELPQRFHVLAGKYGRLAPLAEVDLSASASARVEVRWGEERTEAVSLRLDQTVGELKKELRALVQLPVKGMRLFHMGLGPEEMKNGARALHSYSIRDGDEILVVPREKSRGTSTSSES